MSVGSVIMAPFLLAPPPPMPCGMQGLSSPPGIEPMPPAEEAWSFNHWAAGEVPLFYC